MSKKYPGLTKKEAAVVDAAVARQKRHRLERDAMVSAVQNMMQGLGIPAIEFADEDGKVHGRIDVPKPRDVPCEVPAYGGGTVSIRQGDRIRCWYRDHQTGKWTAEAVGRVFSVRVGTDGFIRLSHMRENAARNEGVSFCCLLDAPSGWARAVEKLA